MKEKTGPVSAQQLPINRRIWTLRACLKSCRLNISRKNLKMPASPMGIRHLAYLLSVNVVGENKMRIVGEEGAD